MLEVINVVKRFEGLTALDGVSLSVKEKAVTGLIGPNGSGKTTLFNVITGFVRPEGGHVLFDSTQLDGLPPHEIARLGISRTFQDLKLVRRLTALDNVLLAFKGQKGEALIHAAFLFSSRSAAHRAVVEKSMHLLSLFGLADKAHEPVERLSYGQQKLLSVACCMAADARLILLDEPASGVSPVLIERMLTLLDDYVHGQGRAALLIEHNLEFVTSLSDIIVVMDGGRKVAEGRADIIRSDRAVLDAYLGGGDALKS